MTLLAGRLPCLHPMERSSVGEDVTQGILKTNTTRRVNKSVSLGVDKLATNNQRCEEGRRLVRFCEAEDEDEEEYQRYDRTSTKAESQDVIKFGNTMYYINSSDPNSAVRKLFPNSKLTPINPFVNKGQPKDHHVASTQYCKIYENNRNLANKMKTRNDNERGNMTSRVVDRSAIRRHVGKVPPETKPKPGKVNSSVTPLIERIKLLTTHSEEISENHKVEEKLGSNNPFKQALKSSAFQSPKGNGLSQQTNVSDLHKQSKGLNLLRYNQNISQSRSDKPPEKNSASPNKVEEARRSFLSSLSQPNDGEPGQRNSVASDSTTADTVYSLSDIEEVLTEDEKEITDAFFKENKPDELEIFVQQDAGRTERLRKRYSTTPKIESHDKKLSSSSTSLSKTAPSNNLRSMNNDKPKFGSTIEILQQLQQQIETPYQMEGRRTACSNYSDSSIPISERLFCDESSDGYEPVIPKMNVQRTSSLDSKNYEDIDNFHYPSAFSVPRTKSHEHPRLVNLEPDSYHYPTNYGNYPGHVLQRNQNFEQNFYTSSPDLHNYQQVYTDRVSAYNNHPLGGRQLHPVLQRQYCRYPVNDVSPNPAGEGKVLTPPVRMHTYMNVPNTAPCYLSPPPYSKVDYYSRPPDYPGTYHYDSPSHPANIYQNIPVPTNANMMTMRRLCTERERGVPEGASSSSDSKEIYTSPPKDLYHSPSLLKSPILPHHYCVDV